MNLIDRVGQTNSLVIFFSVVTALVCGIVVGLTGFNFQLLIVIGIFIISIATMTGRRLDTGLMLWVLTFILGFRVIYVGTLRFHPLTLLLIVLLAKLPAQRRPGIEIQLQLPKLLLIFGGFWLWGLILTLINRMPLDTALNEFINVAIAVPIFIVVQNSFQQNKYLWRKLVTIFFSIGTVIALLGILETNIPEFRGLVPGLVQSTDITVLSPDLFRRSVFAFWGAPSAIYVCVLALPFAFPLWKWNQDFGARLIIVISIFLNIVAMYYAGYRSVWLVGLLGGSVAFFLHYGRVKGTLFALAASLFILQIAPSEGLSRFNSLFELFSVTTIQDTSLREREGRAESAFAMAFSKPLGSGWGASGWTHNDVAQFAANLGIGAAAVFVSWYTWTLFRALKHYRRNDDLTVALIASFIIGGGLMAFNGLQVLTQFIAPMWFVWALIDYESRQKI